MKIIVIEDSKFTQLALDRILLKHGYEVNSASDGGKSLQMERQSCPDAVLLDMMLPSMPGTSILRALKHTPPVASIPTVVLSGL
jgi:CheY-like chemotaxis protein